MEITPLAPALGAEVHGVDLRVPLDDHQQGQLRAAWDEYHLLMFREQQISNDDQLRVAAYFGPVLDESHDASGSTYVSNVKAGAFVPEGALLFHSDLEFTSTPVLGITFFAMEIPADGAPTRFANTVRACERLPESLRAVVDGRKGLHVFDLREQRGDVRFREAELGPPTPYTPRAVHPIVMQHPRMGRDLLYISEMQTDRVIGLDADDSEATLAELRRILYAPDNIYEHRWSVGDFAVWDNLALQHGRASMPPRTEPRTHRRVALGTRTVAEAVPGFVSASSARGR